MECNTELSGQSDKRLQHAKLSFQEKILVYSELILITVPHAMGRGNKATSLANAADIAAGGPTIPELSGFSRINRFMKRLSAF